MMLAMPPLLPMAISLLETGSLESRGGQGHLPPKPLRGDGALPHPSSGGRRHPLAASLQSQLFLTRPSSP